jgi:hypothetical protein
LGHFGFFPEDFILLSDIQAQDFQVQKLTSLGQGSQQRIFLPVLISYQEKESITMDSIGEKRWIKEEFLVFCISYKL